jgi:hypothetical protein
MLTDEKVKLADMLRETKTKHKQTPSLTPAEPHPTPSRKHPKLQAASQHRRINKP